MLAIDVVRKSKDGDIDANAEYYEKSRVIHFKPLSSSRGGKSGRILKAILENPSIEEYPEIRIRLEESSGRERTVVVDRERQDALTGAFQLRTLIDGLDPPLPEASSKIVAHLADRMLEALMRR